jgi:4-hydroxy-3-methylbut-2-enyl diphosphate reductase
MGAITRDDVVILPAFGVSIDDMARLDARGCTLVDTTCGSVLTVWKNVKRYAQDGFTSVIHGKVTHEETRATASQALRYPDGHYLVVLDRTEAAAVCTYITDGGDSAAFLQRFGGAASPGFDPTRHLERIGCANQTTMLMSESLEIGDMFRAAMATRYGADALEARFRAFDTICSATQERQDAVVALLDQEPLDLMVVIGGYNSSNTCNLAKICAERVPTFHIADSAGLAAADLIRHRPVGLPSTAAVREEETRDWLPAGPLTIGLTAGASTPNNIVGQVIGRLETLAGAPPSS